VEKTEQSDGPTRACLLDVAYHLRHLRAHQEAIIGPAGRLAGVRHRPWWR
jgi:hypothetical protein